MYPTIVPCDPGHGTRFAINDTRNDGRMVRRHGVPPCAPLLPFTLRFLGSRTFSPPNPRGILSARRIFGTRTRVSVACWPRHRCCWFTSLITRPGNERFQVHPPTTTYFTLRHTRLIRSCSVYSVHSLSGEDRLSNLSALRRRTFFGAFIRREIISFFFFFEGGGFFSRFIFSAW